MFKLTGTMEVVKVAKSLSDLEGFRVAAKKSGVDLEAAAKTHGLSIQASSDKVLFFRAKMLGYDLPNGNGDSIPRIYASTFGPSFIGQPLDVNHETDPEHIIGKVLATFHVEVPINAAQGEERIIGKNAIADLDDSTSELQLEGICMIDRTTALGNDIAAKLVSGVLNSVSQEASTEYAECSVCAHRVNSPLEAICAHMESGSMMIQSFQVEGKAHKVLAYKVHHNPVGTGLGVVTVPAYDKAKVSDVVAGQEVKAEQKVEAAEKTVELPVKHIKDDIKEFDEVADIVKEMKKDDEKVLKKAGEPVKEDEKVEAAAEMKSRGCGKDLEEGRKCGVLTPQGTTFCSECFAKEHPMKEKTPETAEELLSKPMHEDVKDIRSALVAMFGLSRAYANTNALLAKVNNALEKSGISVTAGRLQGGQDAVVRVAGLASLAGRQYKEVCDAFWMHAAQIDPAVDAAIKAKSGSAKALRAAAANLSAEAKALSPACLIPVTHLMKEDREPKALLAALGRALDLRAFLTTAAPSEFSADYHKAVTALRALCAEGKTEGIKAHLKVLSAFEAKLTKINPLAFGVSGPLEATLLKSGFVAASVAFDETTEKAEAVLAFVAPEKVKEPAKFWIPSSKGGYTLFIHADGTVERIAEDGPKLSGDEAKEPEVEAARLEDMSDDQLKLLKKAWEDAKAKVAEVSKDAESLKLIDSEIEQIGKHMAPVKANKGVDAKSFEASLALIADPSWVSTVAHIAAMGISLGTLLAMLTSPKDKYDKYLEGMSGLAEDTKVAIKKELDALRAQAEVKAAKMSKEGREAVSKDVKKYVKHGKPQKQAVAIALSKARKAGYKGAEKVKASYNNTWPMRDRITYYTPEELGLPELSVKSEGETVYRPKFVGEYVDHNGVSPTYKQVVDTTEDPIIAFGHYWGGGKYYISTLLNSGLPNGLDLYGGDDSADSKIPASESVKLVEYLKTNLKAIKSALELKLAEKATDAEADENRREDELGGVVSKEQDKNTFNTDKPSK